MTAQAPGTRHSLCKTYSRILQYQPQSVDSMTPATVSLPWKGEWRNSRCVCCKWHKQGLSIPSLCICKTNQNKTKNFSFLVEEARLSRSVFNMPLTAKEPFHIFKETKNYHANLKTFLSLRYLEKTIYKIHYTSLLPFGVNNACSWVLFCFLTEQSTVSPSGACHQTSTTNMLKLRKQVELD